MAVVVCVDLGGCRGSDTASPAQKTETTSAAPALPHGTVREDLTFTGDLSGRLDAARHGNVYTCGGMGSIYIVDPILGSIEGKTYELGIQISGFKGPGTYKTGGELTPGSGVAAVSVWIQPEGTQNASRSKSGTIVVNADKRSGTMDADLVGKLGAFHVAGVWTCPPDF
jgi:hypothetical protein